MKKLTKIILIGSGTVLVLVVLVVGFMLWKMGQPVYEFGVVSAEENLRSRLRPNVYEEHIPNAKFVSIDCDDSASISGHFVFDDCLVDSPD